MSTWLRLGAREEVAARAPYALRLDGGGRKAQGLLRADEVAP
jgi:hypothetical protein